MYMYKWLCVCVKTLTATQIYHCYNTQSCSAWHPDTLSSAPDTCGLDTALARASLTRVTGAFECIADALARTMPACLWHSTVTLYTLDWVGAAVYSSHRNLHHLRHISLSTGCPLYVHVILWCSYIQICKFMHNFKLYTSWIIYG